MQSLAQITSNNSTGDPHFDDELTVMSARAVVPLRTVRARAAHRRVWKLIGAFLGSGVLGALVALTFIQFREFTSIIEVPEQVDTNESSLSDNENPTIYASHESHAPQMAEITKGRPPKGKRQIEALLPQSSQSTHYFDPLGSDDLSLLPPQEWEEQRPRRVKQLPQKAGNAHQRRDLKVFDEIFDGVRVPSSKIH